MGDPSARSAVRLPGAQLASHRIHVVYTERELEPDTRVGSRDSGRRDKCRRFARFQKVDERVTELEDGRVVVFEVEREPKNVAVEALRDRQVLDEHRDRCDASGPRCACVSSCCVDSFISGSPSPLVAASAVPPLEIGTSHHKQTPQSRRNHLSEESVERSCRAYIAGIVENGDRGAR